MPQSPNHSTLLVDPKCTVCGVPIARHQAITQAKNQDLVCQSVHCKNVLAKKSSMSHAAFQHFLKFERKVLSDREAHQAAEKARIDDIESSQSQENARLLDKALSQNPHLSKSDISLVEIPLANPTSVPLSAERIDTYRSHIEKILEEARQFENASQVPYVDGIEGVEREMEVNARLAKADKLAEFSDQMCAQCKGGCCASGRDHGYLSVLVVRKFMDRNPEMNEQEVLQFYLDLLSDEVVENSCVNHSSRGCVLPRELRSGICNSFYCDSLNTYQKAVVNGQAKEHVFIVQRASPYWERYKENGSNDVVDVQLVNLDDINPSSDAS